jgi:hypothetical protein
MSFIDSATEVLDRTEASLQALIADALKAKAYRDIVAIAALAEQVAAISTGRAREGKRVAVGVAEVAAGSSAGAERETTKDTTPSWMWPKTT